MPGIRFTNTVCATLIIFFIVKLKLIPVFTLLLTAWFMLTNAKLDPNNPPTGKTGAPGENTCGQSGCHSGGSYTGTVSLSGIPDTIVPGQSYSVTLTNTSNAVRAGFQMTAWDGANAMSGTFTNGTGTSIGTGSASKKYIRQSTPKTLSNGSTAWSFTWKAPTTASGNKVSFYFVSLCANGNGNKSGDNVLQSNKTVVLKTTSPTFEPMQQADIAFYPTLVQNNSLHIELKDAANGTLTIFDMNGKKVMQTALNAVNDLELNGLAKGIYTAGITAGGKVATRKFVVE